MTIHLNNATMAFCGLYLQGVGIASGTGWAIIALSTTSTAPWGPLAPVSFLHLCSFVAMLDERLHIRAGILEPVLERWYRGVILGLAAQFGCMLLILSFFAAAGLGSVFGVLALVVFVAAPLVAPCLAFRVAHRVFV